MTDPFSIATGVAGLLPVAFKLCQTIYETIDKLAHAPRHFKDLSIDLKAFYSVLGTLQGYLDDETTSAGVLHPITYPDLETVLKNCVDTFEKLNTIVCQFRKGPTTEDLNTWQRVQATWKESSIRKLRQELAAHKNTLNVALSVANYINTASTALSTTRIELEVNKLKTDLSALLEKIDRMHERSSDNEVIIANYDHTIRSCVRSAESIIPSWSERVSGSTPSLHVSSAGISYTAVSSSHNNSTYYSAQSRTHSSIVASSNISAALRRKQESTHGIVQASIIANSEASVTRFQNQIPVPSVAHTEPVQLFIKGLTKTSLGFMFSSYTLVDEVLAFLAVRTGVPPHSVFLTYSGKVLELGRILDDYDVRKDSTLFANLRVRGNENEDGDDYSQIRIKTPMGTVINWYGNVGSLNSTVRDVKNYVERKEGIPSDEQRLCFAGGHLEDYRTLRDIMSQSPLRLLLRLQSVKEMDESSEGETPESTPAQLIRIFKPPYAVFNPQLVPMRMRNIRLLAAVRRLRTS